MQMSPRRDACLLRGVPCVCSTRSPLNASRMSARPSACRSPARDLPALRVMQLDSNGISGTLWSGDAGRCSACVIRHGACSSREGSDVEDFAVLTPRGFANLSALEHIDLASNKLAKLPTSAFSGLSKLNFLSLRDNNIKALPRGIVGMDAVCACVQRAGG